MRFPRLRATGACLPKRVITNTELASQLDTSDAWITERTGIRQRCIASSNESTVTLGAHAAQQALARAELATVDLIIVATCTPDQIFPSTACHIQKQLALSPCIAFDVSAACAGFIYALSIAEQFIRAGQVDTALVVGSEIMSRVVDWQDRSTCVLFGDGAGAVLLQADSTPGLHRTVLSANGEHAELLYLSNGMLSDSAYLQMQGREIFRHAVKLMQSATDAVLADSGFSAAEIDWVIPHQANLRIMQAIAKHLGLTDRMIITVDEHANTSSASIPLALDTAIQRGQIQRGQHLIFQGFGGGLVWGAGLMTY